MKILVSFLSILLLSLNASAPAQQPGKGDSCQFSLSGAPAKPVVEGPQEITDRIYFVDQPDSPLEIADVDFSKSALWGTAEQTNYQLHCALRVRNRSDRQILGFNLVVLVGIPGKGTGGGYGARPGEYSLAPGQELETHQGCGGYGGVGLPLSRVRVMVFVDSVDLAGCVYVPSRRFPHDL